MAANPALTPEIKLVAKTQRQSGQEAQPTVIKGLKGRLKEILHEIFEGHEEYLGITPD